MSKYERGERRLDIVEFVRVAHAVGADTVRIVQRVIEMVTTTPARRS